MLAGRHSANSVRVELPEDDHRAGLDRYANAARQLSDWQAAGTLVRDPSPALYVYRMTTPSGSTTTGVIGALEVEPDGSADVLPHEQTLPKPPATVWTSCGPPGPTSRRSGGSRSPPG